MRDLGLDKFEEGDSIYYLFMNKEFLKGVVTHCYRRYSDKSVTTVSVDWSDGSGNDHICKAEVSRLYTEEEYAEYLADNPILEADNIAATPNKTEKGQPLMIDTSSGIMTITSPGAPVGPEDIKQVAEEVYEKARMSLSGGSSYELKEIVLSLLDK